MCNISVLTMTRVGQIHWNWKNTSRNNKKAGLAMAVKLTSEEQDMLEGKCGKSKQAALKGIIRYAEILGATELVEVTKTHLCCGSEAVPADFPDGQLNREDYLKEDFYDHHIKHFLPELNRGEFSGFYEKALLIDDVHTSDSYQWAYTQQTKEFWEMNQQIMETAIANGCVAGSTCAPYLAGWLPTMGEYFVTTESSNVLYCNSVLGARGNGGGGATSMMTAVCGRAPKWGLHLTENRHGTHVFRIHSKLETKLLWDMVGIAVGRRLAPNAIPVLTGEFDPPDLIKLKTMFTSLATASGCEMCLIVGTSPEAPTYEAAMAGHAPAAEFDIDEEMLEGYRRELCHPVSGPVDFLQIGCPNSSVQEIQQIERYMRGKHVKEGVRFCVFTNVAQYELARLSHLIESLRKSGVEVLTSGCILRCVNVAYGAKGIGLSAAKLAHYSKTERSVPVYYGTEREVMDAAISGYWQVR